MKITSKYIIIILIVWMCIMAAVIFGWPHLSALLFDRPVESLNVVKSVLPLLAGIAVGLAIVKSLTPIEKLTVKRIVVTAAAALSVFVLLVLLFTTKEWDKISIVVGLVVWLLFTAISSLVCTIIYKVLKKKGSV